MKKVCVIGSNLYELSDTILKNVKTEFGFFNKIVVPDKFSMLAELGYFENTNRSCTFDTEVISISKLAHLLLSQVGVEVNVLTSQQQALLVKKAIKNCKDKLKVIKTNVNSGFYNELSKTISQLKSSNVDLTKYDNIALDKINDFKNIICEYEKLLQGKLDNNDLLTVLCENFDKFEFLKNTRFYFVGFDSLTAQAFEILNLLTTYSDVWVGALVPANQNLKSIYDLDIYNKISLLGGFEFVMADNSLNFFQSLIANNLFSNNPTSDSKKEFLTVAVAKNIEDEIEYVFNYLANNLKDNAGDYSIAVAGIDQFVDILEEKASFYNLPVYIDTALSLKNTNLYRFIENIINFVLTGFSKNNLINFWASEFVKIENLEKADIINIIEEYSLFNKNYFKLEKYLSENAKNYFNLLNNFIKNIKNCKKTKEFCDILLQFIVDFNCSDIIFEICKQFNLQNNLKQEKLYLQVYDKFVDCVNKVCEMLADYDFVLSEFYDDFLTFVENVKITIVPISANCVYIADATDNFFAKTKHLFVINASGEALPVTSYDCGLILDVDIENNKELKNVAPTINMINKRNKFKLYNLCLCPSQNLTITYSFSESGKDIPCYFVNELMDIFGLKQDNVINISQYFDFVDKQSQTDYVLKNVNNINNATSVLLKMVNKSYNNNQVSNSLYNVINNQAKDFTKFIDFDNNKQNLENAENLFFENKTTKITQLEDYFVCPYMHFVRHGLKLKENKSHEIDARDYGNVFHYVAENFLKQKQEFVAEQFISSFLDTCFENMSNLDKFKKFELNEQNKMYFKFLKQESYDLCKALIVHKDKSDFLNFKQEYGFTHQISNLKINGFIDRIDKCQTNDKTLYRVIDYKSGNPSMTIKDVYCGLQIQPAVYGAIVKKSFGDCSGIFLMPLKNQKSSDSYKLKGFFKKDIDIVRKMDKDISFENPSSKLLNVRISTKKQNREKGVYEITSGSGLDNFDNMLDYSYKLAQDAIQKLKQGQINCLPCEDKCKICAYHSICNFDKLYKNSVRQNDFEVDEKSFSPEEK